MHKIISKKELAENIFEIEVEARAIAKKARAGQFVVVLAKDAGERIPLTLADWDSQKGTVTLVYMVVGTSTAKLSELCVGDNLLGISGPLGCHSEIEEADVVVMVAGGVGTAPIFPIAREYKNAGTTVITIQGARSKSLLFWEEKMAEVSDQHIITTDDGSAGRKGLVTEPLKEILEMKSDRIGKVYAIGPSIMMKFCSLTTKPFKVDTVVSLNSIMIDATGMCGVCRVEVGGKTKLTCTDGPEFDGHLVNWDLLMDRLRGYLEEEKISYDKYQLEVEMNV